MTWIALPSGTMLKEDDIAAIKVFSPKTEFHDREYKCILKGVEITSSGIGSISYASTEVPHIIINQEDYDALRAVLKTKTVGIGHTPRTDVPPSGKPTRP